MNSQADLLKRVTAALEAVGVAYMVTGSIGSSLHGHPRATNDLDIVISPNEEQLDSFVESFGEDYYISTHAAKDAFNHKSMFNIISHIIFTVTHIIIRNVTRFLYLFI